MSWQEFLIAEIDKILDMSDNELKINFPQVTSRISTIKYGAMILKYFLNTKAWTRLFLQPTG